MSLREIEYTNYSCLTVLEELIGSDGYFEMFQKCNAHAVTILRIMACSQLSDSLVEKISSNMKVWDDSRERIQEDSSELLKDFYKDLNNASRRKHKNFFKFLRDKTSAEEWVSWFCQGSTLVEFILIMEKLPFTLAKKIACYVFDNFNEVMKYMRLVEQNRQDSVCVDQQRKKQATNKMCEYHEESYTQVAMNEVPE